VGISFVLDVSGRMMSFKMPIRTERLLRHFRGDRVKARRVAWRQSFRLLEAQLATAEAGISPPHEIFLPYLVAANGVSLFDQFMQTGFKQLPAAGGE
jgi:hypothetical protein